MKSYENQDRTTNLVARPRVDVMWTVWYFDRNCFRNILAAPHVRVPSPRPPMVTAAEGKRRKKDAEETTQGEIPFVSIPEELPHRSPTDSL